MDSRQFDQLLHRLIEKTKSGILAWKEIGDTFEVFVSEHVISLWKDPVEETYKFEIADEEGKLVDEIVLPHHEPRFELQRRAMRDLYKLVRGPRARINVGQVDWVVDKILQSLA